MLPSIERCLADSLALLLPRGEYVMLESPGANALNSYVAFHL